MLHRDSHFCCKGKKHIVSLTLPPGLMQRKSSFPWGIMQPTGLPGKKFFFQRIFRRTQVWSPEICSFSSNGTLAWIPKHSVLALLHNRSGYKERKFRKKMSVNDQKSSLSLRINPVLISYFGLEPADSAIEHPGADCHMGERTVLLSAFLETL